MTRLPCVLAAVLLCAAVIYTGCGGDDDNGNGPVIIPPPRVVAAAHMNPTFDNALTSPVWDSIDAAEFTVGSDTTYSTEKRRSEKVTRTVKMKALVAGDSLYLWAQWNDFDADTLFGQLRANWVNNLLEWALNIPIDTNVYNEDRFFVIFDQGGPNGADCASFCHMPSDTSTLGRRFYGAAGDDADIWHWKALRTGFADLAEDMYLTTDMVSGDPIVSPTGDILYFKNYDSLYNSGPSSYIVTPKYMHENGPAYEGATLMESEAPGNQFVDYDGGLEWYVNDPPPPQQPYGRTLPGWYIRDVSGADGSRWDVRAKSAHADGMWTVVFQRALTPADPDDVDLNFATTDSISISIAVFESTGDSTQHWGRAPFYLVFE
jgi:hypothetical protein